MEAERLQVPLELSPGGASPSAVLRAPAGTKRRPRAAAAATLHRLANALSTREAAFRKKEGPGRDIINGERV